MLQRRASKRQEPEETMNVESHHRSKKLKLEQTGVPGLSQTQGEDMAFGHAFFSDAANIGDIATPLFRKYQAAVNLFSQLVELWSVSTSSKPRTLDAVYDANENAWVEEDDKCLSTRIDAVTYGADGKVIDVINDDSSQPRIVVTEMDDQVRFALTGVVQFSVPLCRHTLLYWVCWARSDNKGQALIILIIRPPPSVKGYSVWKCLTPFPFRTITHISIDFRKTLYYFYSFFNYNSLLFLYFIYQNQKLFT